MAVAVVMAVQDPAYSPTGSLSLETELKYKWLPRPEMIQTESNPETQTVPGPVGSLLQRRGLGQAFINAGYDSLSKWNSLPGAENAACILEEAIRNDETILVHGDFDADGITATATALRVIRALGGRVQHHVPCRFDEGYGLGNTGVEKCLEIGAGVLITVDCGITACRETSVLRAAGVKVVVTDHHVPSEELPDALAIVNPELSGNSSAQWRYLSGAGVIHFVLQGLALRMNAGNIPELEPDLVAIGTVCDMVPLTGDNRILVKRGLDILRSQPSPGIAALIRASGADYSKLNARDIGFALGPRINSSGRIIHADHAVKLLLETDPRLAEELAVGLDQANQKRKLLDSRVFSEVREMLKNTDLPVAVAASSQWHPGVIGISASRLAQELNRPVILIAWDGDTGRGSARGVPGMPVHPLLFEAMEAGLLLKFGGHEQAAGLTIEKSRFEEFKLFSESLAERIYESTASTVLYIDGGLDSSDCNSETLSFIEKLSPFGEGNPEPVWIARGVYPVAFRSVGLEGKHLQVSFQQGADSLRAIGFDMGHRTSELNRLLDIAFTLAGDDWRGGGSVQLVLKDMKPAAGRNK
jgi:single-stranded-DNA-specific exonuclease